jgi:hypothetical protein
MLFPWSKMAVIELAAQIRAGDNFTCIGAHTIEICALTGLLLYADMIKSPYCTPQAEAMMTKPTDPMPPEATRAMEEAEARRKADSKASAPKEYGGPKGCEPTRYGDWERKGIASDF